MSEKFKSNMQFRGMATNQKYKGAKLKCHLNCSYNKNSLSTFWQ